MNLRLVRSLEMLLEAMYMIRQFSRWPRLEELQQLSRRIRETRAKMSAAELGMFEPSSLLCSGHEFETLRDYIYGDEQSPKDRRSL